MRARTGGLDPAATSTNGARPPVDIWETVLAFADAQAVLTAHDRGVFEALACGSAHVQEIAARIRLPVASCERLLTFLVALGILERLSEGRYANRAETQQQLVIASPNYIGHFLPYVRNVLYPAWSRLDVALDHMAPQCVSSTGENQHELMFEDPEQLRGFLAGMHPITYQSARVLAAVAPELRALDLVVDVGGASGAFLIALAEAAAMEYGVVFDLPPVVAIAEEYIRSAGFVDRISCHGGDFWRDPLPAGADAYGLGFILHDWDDEGGDRILDKIAAAAPRGAILIVGEHVLNDDRSGPLFAVRQDLNMLVSARGRERSEAEYRDWIRRHGFMLRRTHPAPYGKHYMIAERL